MNECYCKFDPYLENGEDNPDCAIIQMDYMGDGKFKCPECGKIIEIDKPLSEQYVPTCCNQQAKRIFTAPNISAGCLDRNNLTKG